MSPHEEHPSAAKQHTKRKVSLLFILLFGCVGYSSILYMMANIVQDWRQDRQAAAATRAVDYPWLYYPISEESKQALCAALSLPPEHAVCRANREVMFGETSKTLREVFPEKKTTVSQVEERLTARARDPWTTDNFLPSGRAIEQLPAHQGSDLRPGWQHELLSLRLPADGVRRRLHRVTNQPGRPRNRRTYLWFAL